MSKMPVFYVFVKKNGKNIDISNLIESFSFDDSTEKDNFLKLSVFSKYAQTFDEKNEVSTGDVLIFNFGFLGGKMSPNHTCIVKEIQYEYDSRVRIIVKALDKGNEIKKTIGGNVYSGKTAKDVVSEIANRNKLKSIIEDGNFDVSSIAQGNRSDLDFVKYLASIEPSGTHIAYIRGNTMYYVKQGTNRKSAKKYDYKDADNGFIRFSSNFSEAGKSAQSSNSTTAVSFDPLAKKVSSDKVNARNESEDTKVGNNKVVPSTLFNQNADSIGKVIATPPKNGNASTGNPDNRNTGIANSERKKQILKATLTVELDPSIEPNEVITMSGVFKRDIGNWLVVSITHDISGSGGISTMQLTKNGTNATIGGKSVDAKKKNKTVGPDKSNTKKIVFNQNAEII